jgi:prepilin-type N-terminal cleavage/methylation domain-containing protein
MTKRARIVRPEDGFTIVEMLSAMAVFGIVLATFSMVMSSTIRHSGEVEQQTNIQVEARGAITAASQDIRQAYDGDDNLATSPIVSLSANQLTVLSPDRQLPFHLRKITYRLNAGTLERAFLTSTDNDGAPWVGISGSPSAYQAVVRDVVNTGTGSERVFVYRDADGVETSNPLLVRTIEVNLIVATKTAASRKYTYRTSITVRGES